MSINIREASMNRAKVFLAACCIITLLAHCSLAQPGNGRGRGLGRGHGGSQAAGREQSKDPDAQPHAQADRHQADHQVLQFLLANHQKIKRTVTELPDGVETLTESSQPEIAAKIKEHVEWMEYRVENTNPIRMRDPLFAELFKHTHKIHMEHEHTQKGVRVIETSDDPYVVKLIQAHAKAVSGFVEHGFAEAMKNHAVPPAGAATDVDSVPKLEFPVIAGHGAVVKLPTAAHQPRAGAKLLVDVTSGGAPESINPALDKVAKYLNIYAGGGKIPAEVHIAVVLHGGATLAVLNPDAYTAKFQTDGNPNLELLHQLHEAGVEFFVCGQSLISKGATPDEVVVFVDTAVSALTAVVNLQSDGYAYVPLGQ